jgi:hypothetical protein
MPRGVRKEENVVRIETEEINVSSDRKDFVKQFCLNRTSFTGHTIDSKLIKEANRAYDEIEKL